MTPSHDNRQGMKRLGASLLFCLILFGVLAYASAVLKPTRSLSRMDAGAAWDGYLRQPRDSIDVLFFGNSHAFSGVDPSVLWRSSGISSYVLAGPAQPLSLTRRYVAEALRTQKPRVIAIELSTLTYDKRNYVTEFQLTNVGYMPMGVNRALAAIVDTPKADRMSALVDLLAYHGRWTELKLSDLDLRRRDPDDAFLKGYYVRAKSRPVTATASAPEKPKKASIVAAEARNIAVLREIARLCEDNDVELLLFLTPTAPEGVYRSSLQRAAKELSREFDNVRTVDLSGPREVQGLSYRTDFSDGGHLAASGAQKTSKAMAAYLARTYGLTDHRGDPAFAAWDSDALRHDLFVAKLLSEAR